ncbi:sprT-like domain-containing protein [Pelomyxa schiedti]|nr:sprT-like domain-containing protein [Pelomyxa schiedti]
MSTATTRTPTAGEPRGGQPDAAAENGDEAPPPGAVVVRKRPPLRSLDADLELAIALSLERGGEPIMPTGEPADVGEEEASEGRCGDKLVVARDSNSSNSDALVNFAAVGIVKANVNVNANANVHVNANSTGISSGIGNGNGNGNGNGKDKPKPAPADQTNQEKDGSGASEPITPSLTVQNVVESAGSAAAERGGDLDSNSNGDCAGESASASASAGRLVVTEHQNELLALSCEPTDWFRDDSPHPDVFALFVDYNQRLFGSKLDAVSVSWSSKMTLCAGLCKYNRKGGICEIRLSEPLLKYRPASDVVNTLLHEMIHAYLFVTHNNRDHGDHGPNFRTWMATVNAACNAHVTVYHSFSDEVDHYRVHWWQCNGSCRTKPPHFGIVKRNLCIISTFFITFAQSYEQTARSH